MKRENQEERCVTMSVEDKKLSNKQIAENIIISTDGIKNSLKKYKPLQALGEYVWNGFDANATQVQISIVPNELLWIREITVKDNGIGIDRALLDQKFKPFFQSEKIYDPDIKHSATHGKNGVGRLTFFSFANYASWNTVYQRDNKKFRYTIDVNSYSLENYSPSNEIETEEDQGTIVSFAEFVNTELTKENVESYLALEFCWFLELNREKDFKIIINGQTLNYDYLIISSEDIEYACKALGITHKVHFVCWKSRLSDYSKYYFIRSDGSEVAKENTTLNNKGDHFYHSVYIQSSIFDNFNFAQIDMSQVDIPGFYSKKSPVFEDLMRSVNSRLIDIRRPYIKHYVSEAIEKLEIDEAFPNYDKKSIMYSYKKGLIEELCSAIYIAQPKLFTDSMNKEQKRTFIRLLDLIMETGEVSSLFSILSEILEMNDCDRKELADILKLTNMSNITRTINLLKDRHKAVEELKQLVLNPDLHANEVFHLQKMIEKHYWLFGEEYNLVTAAEPNFEEALRRFLKYLREDCEDATIAHPDKLKQMDIYAIRRDITHNKYNNIVVELKHPLIRLGEKQLSQVKKYMRVILSEDRFNASNMTWEFYLIGNEFSKDQYIENEIENNKNHGIAHLVYSVGNQKIYVVKWSEIFAEFEMRYSYLYNKLQLKQSEYQKSLLTADEIIAEQNSNTAKASAEMPHS